MGGSQCAHMPDPARIASTTLAVHRIGGGLPVTTSTLVSHGLSRARIKAAAHRHAIVQAQRGIWLTAADWRGAPDDRARLILASHAALLAFPGCVLSHDTAAALHALPAPSSDEWSRRSWFHAVPESIDGWPTVHLTRVKGRSIASRSSSPWIQVHGGHGKVRPFLVDGLPCTDVVTTAIDLGCQTTARWALALMDAAFRMRFGVGADSEWIRREIQGRIRRHVRRPGIRRIRRIAPFVNPASESALESISRWHMHRARIPTPEVNGEIRGSDGRTYRGDFCWGAQRVVGEADGMGKYTSLDDLKAEKRRQFALEQAGWRIVRWGWEDAVWRPRQMVAMIRDALATPHPHS